MNVDDMTLLRELRRAVDGAAEFGIDAQAQAVRDVLARHDATLEDVSRAVGKVKQRRRTELSGLSRRLSRLADQREDAVSTADAVDAFIRGLGRPN